MGFLKNKIFIYLFVLSVALSGCAKPLIFVNFVSNYGDFNRVTSGGVKAFYTDRTLGDSLKLIWNEKTHGGYANTFLRAYKDILFVPDLSGIITAFDFKTGKELGAIKNNGEIRAAPILYKTTLIFIVNNLNENYGTLHFYNLTNGWDYKVKIPFGSKGELLGTKENLFVLAKNGTLYKFNYQRRKLWQTNATGLTFCSPTLDANQIFFGNQKGELISVDSKTGKIWYRRKISAGFEGGITSFNGSLFIGDKNGIVYKVSTDEGRVVWKFDTGSKIKNFITFHNKQIFVGNLAGKLYSFNMDTGEVNWTSYIGGVINATPLIFNNYIVQPNLNKNTYIIDINNGKIKRTIKFDNKCRTAPGYYQGMLYFGIDNGEIYAYEVIE